MDTEKYKMGWLVVAFDLPVITRSQRKEATVFRKFLLDDARAATKAALEEGIVPGGGVALLRCEKAVDALLDTVELFGMGYSWGGFESLVIPFDCAGYRTATTWAPGGPTLRLHIGLENVEDLKADLARGFEAFNAA